MIQRTCSVRVRILKQHIAEARDIIALCAIHPRSSELLQLRNMLLNAIDWSMPEYRQKVGELGKQDDFGKHTIL
jgi:hypothetical protein